MKSIWRLLSIALFSGLICTAFSTKANADDWNRKTYITTNQPMEIPGRIILPAGEYTIKLLDLTSSRNVVEFFSRDEKKLYNTVMAIPTYQLEPAEQTQLTFYEAAPGHVHAVRTWITQGSVNGLEFLYPRARAKELAMMKGGKITTPEASVAPAAEPSQSDGDSDMDGVATSSVAAPAADNTVAEAAPMDDVDGVDSQTAAVAPQEKTPDITAPAPAESTPDLPKTAGIQELLLLVGMGSSAGAFAIRRFRR